MVNRTQFFDEGFVILDDIFTPEEIDRIRDGVLARKGTGVKVLESAFLDPTMRA